MARNYYEILGVNYDVTNEQICSVYNSQLESIQNENRLEIDQAFRVLSDSNRRKEYDESLIKVIEEQTMKLTNSQLQKVRFMYFYELANLITIDRIVDKAIEYLEFPDDQFQQIAPTRKNKKRYRLKRIGRNIGWFLLFVVLVILSENYKGKPISKYPFCGESLLKSEFLAFYPVLKNPDRSYVLFDHPKNRFLHYYCSDLKSLGYLEFYDMPKNDKERISKKDLVLYRFRKEMSWFRVGEIKTIGCYLDSIPDSSRIYPNLTLLVTAVRKLDSAYYQLESGKINLPDFFVESSKIIGRLDSLRCL